MGNRYVQRCIVAAMAAFTMQASATEPSFPAPQVHPAIEAQAHDVVRWPKPAWRRLEPGVQLAEVELKDREGGVHRLWVYRPDGASSSSRRPVVLIAASGSEGMTGRSLELSHRAEHLAYAREGLVVVAYELDGPGNAFADLAAFDEAQGGLVNGLTALAYAKERLVEADPHRVFAVGYRSAADVALLLGAHEPELAGVVAYNSSGEGCWTQPGIFLDAIGAEYPGLASFCQRTRAANHLHHMRVPVFFFGSENDVRVPGAAVRRLAERASEAGVPNQVQVGPYGDHQGSMLHSGIPAALAWMARQSVQQAELAR